LTKQKIVTLQQMPKLRDKLKQAGKKTVLCHGVFDLLHPGHIAHLEEAKAMGDVLVVSITSAPYVNRGPGRPYFSDELRLKSLAALACIDYVLAIEAATATEAIDCVQPDYYVKGKEYAVAEDDVTGNIDKEADRVRSYGGDICFTDGIVFSSTKLLNQNFSVFPPGVKEFAQDFASRVPFESVRKTVDQMKKLKVLVVGDIIIDEYVFCTVQGLTSKDRTFSARYQREERYLGGSLAVAKHLAGFSNHVSVCAIVGEDPAIHSQILNDLSPLMRLDLQFNNDFRTTVKRRFVERRGIRNEYDKLFSMNYLPDDVDDIREVDRKSFHDRLEKEVPKYDLVVVTDFGHGLLDPVAMDILQTKSPLLALNCQTNSSNFGTNLITKYRHADCFTLDIRELRLALANSNAAEVTLLKELMHHLQAKVGWVTLGSLGSVALDRDLTEVKTPALTLSVQDTVGAGDAFFSLASLGVGVGATVEESSFLGNLAGALAANILGNSSSVQKSDLLKFASTLLKF
jgi:rfaE bifunctional protein nucleotidyltransferase chain/domain